MNSSQKGGGREQALEVCGFSSEEVGGWLEERGLEYCVGNFRENGIDGSILQEMDDFDLVLLDVKKEDHAALMGLMRMAKEGGTWRRKEEERELRRREKEMGLEKEKSGVCSLPSSPTYQFAPSAIFTPPLSRHKSKKHHQRRKNSLFEKLLPSSLAPPKTSFRSQSHSPTQSTLSPLSPLSPLSLSSPRSLYSPRSPRFPDTISPPSSPPSFIPSTFTESDVREWLLETGGGGGGGEWGGGGGGGGGEGGLGKYAQVFYQNCVDGEVLLMLTPSDLRALGVCLEDMDHFVGVLEELRKVDQKEKRKGKQRERQQRGGEEEERVVDEEVVVVVGGGGKGEEVAVVVGGGGKGEEVAVVVGGRKKKKVRVRQVEESPSLLPPPHPSSVVIKVTHKKEVHYCPLYPYETFTCFAHRIFEMFPLSSSSSSSSSSPSLFLSYSFPPSTISSSPSQSPSPSPSPSPSRSPSLSPSLSPYDLHHSHTTPNPFEDHTSLNPFFSSPCSTHFPSPSSLSLSPTLLPSSGNLSSSSLLSDVAPSPPSSPFFPLPSPSLSLAPSPPPSLFPQKYLVDDDNSMDLLFNHAVFLSKQQKKLRVSLEKMR